MVQHNEEQQAVISAAPHITVKMPLKVKAFAGAGKTTTLVGVAQAMQSRGGYFAFNREIAREAQQKFRNTGCTASTMHALALSVMRPFLNGGPVSGISIQDIRKHDVFARKTWPRVVGFSEFHLALAVSNTMKAFAQSDDPGFRLSHAHQALHRKTGDPDLMVQGLRKEKALRVRKQLERPLAEAARDLWKALCKQGVYTHDMYLKALDYSDDLRHQAFSRFSYLMVDEAQDINPVQRSILTKASRPLIAVGDSYQQIYMWRGAENTLDTWSGKTLHLTQSFRFDESIAAIARRILASRPDGGPAERLTGVGSGKTPVGWDGPMEALICRSNMGVIDAAITQMDDNRPVVVDNVKDLLKDLRSAEALRDNDLEKVESPAFKGFESWEELEQEAEEGDQTLKKVVNLVKRNRVGIVGRLNALATDVKRAGTDAVFVCTAHRSKGLEFPIVTLGEDWKSISKMRAIFEKARTKTQKDACVEEWNALYVAATRAMVALEQVDRVFETEGRSRR